MNFFFLLAGFGFVTVAGVLYYFTSKSDNLEEVPKNETKEAPKPVVPTFEVIIISFIFLSFVHKNLGILKF